MTEKEINNIVYLAMKYAFRVEDIQNNKIHEAVMDLVDSSNQEEIVEALYNYMYEEFPDSVDKKNPDKQKWHINFIIQEFQKLPEDLRNDLGQDENSEDFITKH